MPNEIYHRSNWGESKAEDFGDVYYDHAATNKLYNHSDYYENSDGTDATLKDLNNKASIVLTPTAYSDGSLNTVIPPYQVLPTELITNGTFDTDLSGWQITNSDATHTVTHTSDGARFQSDTTTPIMFFETIDVILQGGKKYSLTVEIVNRNSGELKIQGNNINLFYTDNGVFTDVIEPTGDSRISFYRNSSNVDITIKSVSLKEIQEADFDFSRGSSATRVNEQGLVEDVQILSGELVQNGDFEQIGAEEVTNGNFDTDSDWNKPVGLTISNGVASANNVGGGQQLWQSFTSIGIYKVEFTISNYTIGGVKPIFHGATYTGASSVTANGTYIQYIKVTSTPSRFSFQFQGTSTMDIDNVSVKEVGQNWSFGTGWSMGDGKAVRTGTDSTALSQSFSALQSKKFRLSFEVSDWTVGHLKGYFYGGGGSDEFFDNTSIGNGSFTFEVTTTVNRTNFAFLAFGSFDGSIDNVSIKEVTDDTDLPRIDFTDGTGSLLLEPQRTNSVPYSNDFSQHSLTGGSITSDDIVSPDGSINADTFVEDTNNSQHKIREDISVTSGTYTMSCFVKGTDRFISFYPQGVSTAYAVFDIANENITASGGSDYVDSQIQSFENDWYRCSLTYNVGTGTSYTHIYLSNSDTNPAPTYTGDGSEMSFYGLQLESGDYLTSYIPTSGSTVTRSADVANNSGNADLFNDSEGVLYAEIAALADDGTSRRIAISDGTNDNRVVLAYYTASNQVRVIVITGASLTSDMTYTINDTTQVSKIAFSYKQNDFKLWIDGVQRTTDDSGATPTGLKELAFDSGSGSNDFYGKTKCLAVFKEALSNDLLERLTGEGYESFRLLAEANNYTII